MMPSMALFTPLDFKGSIDKIRTEAHNESCQTPAYSGYPYLPSPCKTKNEPHKIAN